MPIAAINKSASVVSRPAPAIRRISSGTGRLLPGLEQLFVFLLLLASMNVLTALTPSSQEQTNIKAASADVDTYSVAIEAGLYTFGGILALMRWRRVLRAARTVWPLLALAAFACLSTTWSVEPIVTLRRSVALLAATTMAIYVGERYSIQAFARLLARTFCFMMMLIVLLYLVAPEYVVDYSAYGGAWKGLSTYKNTFGEHMAVALVLLVLVRFRRFAWTRYVFLLAAASLLLLSRSATAVLCGVLGLATIPLWRLMHGKQRSFAYLLLTLLLVAGIYCILAFPEPLFQILGRDATLTGRTRLWTMLLPVIANRPILGYGYAAFWTGLKPEVLGIWIEAGRLVPVADNGYFDLCLSLGAVGVCLFLYVFVRAFRSAIEFTSEPALIGVWPVTYLCIFAVDNICESGLLTRGTFPFLVFAILTTSLAMNYKGIVTSTRRAESRPFLWEATAPVILR
jgi:exopolysaccharide production protein ExoQ